MTTALNRSVLMLNATFEPLQITSARHALVLVLRGNAVVEAVSKFSVRTPHVSIPVPDVIRLTRYRRVPRQNRSVSRKGILLRDGFMCQYCGRDLPPGDLTLDHVMPKSRGGQFTWENIVASCFPCNGRKDNRTPQEAGMTLLCRPMAISIHSKLKLLSRGEESWRRFMFV